MIAFKVNREICIHLQKFLFTKGWSWLNENKTIIKPWKWDEKLYGKDREFLIVLENPDLKRLTFRSAYQFSFYPSLVKNAYEINQVEDIIPVVVGALLE